MILISISQFILDGFKVLSTQLLGERDRTALNSIATEAFLKNNVVAYLMVEILAQKSGVSNIFDISLKILLLLHSHLDIVYSNYAFSILDKATLEYHKDEQITPEKKLKLYQKAVGANKLIFVLFSVSIFLFVTFSSLFRQLSFDGILLLVAPLGFSAVDNLKKLCLAHWRIKTFDQPPFQESSPMLFLPQGFFFHQICDIFIMVHSQFPL